MNFININICRVCMKAGDTISIDSEQEIKVKFAFTTRLKLCDNDNMPRLLCQLCLERLQNAHDFIADAQASERKLREFIRKISNDFKIVTGNVVEDTPQEPAEDAEPNTNTYRGDDWGDGGNDGYDGYDDKILEPKSVMKRRIKKPQASKLSLKNKKDKDVKLSSPEGSTGGHQAALPSSNDSTPDNTAEESKGASAGTIATSESVNDLIPIIALSGAKGDSMEIDLPSGNFILAKCTVDEGDPKGNEEANEGSLEEHINDRSLDIAEEYYTLCESAEDAAGGGSVAGSTFSHSELTPSQEDDIDMERNVGTHVYTLQESDDTSTGTYAIVWEGNLNETGSERTSNAIADIVGQDSLDAEKPSETKQQKRKIVSGGSGGKRKTHKGDSLPEGRQNKSSTSSSTSKTLEARYVCAECQRDFSTKTNLTRHMISHRGVKPFECPQCGKHFTQNGSLKHHMYIHTGEKPYVCRICDRGFTQCKSLVFHMRRHSGEKPFPCELCNHKFRHKDGLKVHISKHHVKRDDKEGFLVCEICKGLLKDTDALHVHLRKHLNNTVTNEAIAPIIAPTPSELNHFEDHDSDMFLEVVSAEDLLIKCDLMEDFRLEDVADSAQVLDVSSSSAAAPTRAKKFQCRTCFKTFAIKQNLLRHLTIHNHHNDETEQSFPCQCCNLGYDSEATLRDHMREEHVDSMASGQLQANHKTLQEKCPADNAI